MQEQFLEGQVAVITGAGRGIGSATARLLAQAGADLVIAARTLSELEETAAEARALGRSCAVVPTDVAEEAACENLIERALALHGKIDILINNAGAARFKPMWELTAEDFDLNLNVNLRGTFFCARAAVRAMIPRQSGHIINVASNSGKKPYATQAAYCAAKAGVIALSKVMAVELRPHKVRVSVVCLGGVDTRLAAEAHPTRDKTGWIQPEDVAEAILYLLSTPPNITTDELVIRRFEADPI
ncbi:MAG TPA: SDR family oxidoreductase [Chthonomonadaceae bacterium]|nr:SDR family oxidoreductase [Chthonomonadaceae bacterium]